MVFFLFCSRSASRRNSLAATLLALFFFLAERLRCALGDSALDDDARFPPPTRVFRAHPTLQEQHNDKQQFNIGVIQVRLKHWTTMAPLAPISVHIAEEFHSPFRRGASSLLDSFKYKTQIETPNRLSYYENRRAPQSRHAMMRSPPLTLPSPQNGVDNAKVSEENAKRDVEARDADRLRRKNYVYHHRSATNAEQAASALASSPVAYSRSDDELVDSAPTQEQQSGYASSESAEEKGDTFFDIFDALWRRVDLLNSPLAYMIIAVTFMLVALLVIIYALLAVTLNRRRRRRLEREKYEEIRLVLGDDNNVAEAGHQQQRYLRYQQTVEVPTLGGYRTRRREDSFTLDQRVDAPIPPPRRYASGANSRSQTPKNSLNSLQRHQIEHYAPADLSPPTHHHQLHQHYIKQKQSQPDTESINTESELERLYRSISPFKRHAPTITPSMTSDDSVSLMRRVGATRSAHSGNGGDGNSRNVSRRRRQQIGERKRQRSRRPPLESPPPPPPPRVPPPPVPPQ